jgi:hypothetical protein
MCGSSARAPARARSAVVDVTLSARERGQLRVTLERLPGGTARVDEIGVALDAATDVRLERAVRGRRESERADAADVHGSNLRSVEREMGMDNDGRHPLGCFYGGPEGEGYWFAVHGCERNHDGEAEALWGTQRGAREAWAHLVEAGLTRTGESG